MDSLSILSKFQNFKIKLILFCLISIQSEFFVCRKFPFFVQIVHFLSILSNPGICFIRFSLRSNDNLRSGHFELIDVFCKVVFFAAVDTMVGIYPQHYVRTFAITSLFITNTNPCKIESKIYAQHTETNRKLKPLNNTNILVHSFHPLLASFSKKRTKSECQLHKILTQDS